MTIVAWRKKSSKELYKQGRAATGKVRVITENIEVRFDEIHVATFNYGC